MEPEMTVIHPASTQEGKETMQIVKGMVSQVVEDGYGDCKLCGKRFHGDFGEVLEQLGRHGEAHHPNNN